MVFMSRMGHVEPCDVHAGVDQLLQLFLRFACRAYGTNDLGLSHEHASIRVNKCYEDISI